MACTNCGGDAKTIIRDGDGITFSGVGTAVDPYVPHLSDLASQLAFEVRDSQSINFTLFGSGLTSDPYVLTGDTSSASRLANLGDVASSPAPSQGTVPMWVGSTTGGQFQFRLLGTRYTTHATRGNGLYQGEQIKETDTGDRFEWDGSQWVSLNTTSVPASALDSSVIQSKGTIDASVDWNTLTVSGIYRVNAGVTSSNNSPGGAYAYGTLTVAQSGLSVTQTYVSHVNPKTYTRTKFSAADWTYWFLGAGSGDIVTEQTARASAVSTLQTNLNNEIFARATAIGNVYTKAQIDAKGLIGSYDAKISITAGGGSRVSQFVSFPAGRFTAIPTSVQVSASTSTPDNVSVGYMNPSTTGVTVWMSRTDTSGGSGIATEISVTAFQLA